MTTLTQFDRQQFGFRFVETNHGDTLQLIALRYLGDAARWTELISYNKLVPPYITDDANLASDGVLLSGSLILVPSVAQATAVGNDPEQVLRTDVQLYNKKFLYENGDFKVVSGLENLKQGLRHALDTERGELLFHPQYGSLIRQLIGAINGPTRGLLAGEYARGPVEADDRIVRVTSTKAVIDGDKILITVIAESALGKPVTIDATL